MALSLTDKEYIEQIKTLTAHCRQQELRANKFERKSIRLEKKVNKIEPELERLRKKNKLYTEKMNKIINIWKGIDSNEK